MEMLDINSVQDFRKKLALAFGVGGLALLAIILGPHPRAFSTPPNERGHYGRS
jgi:hypothetical protein